MIRVCMPICGLLLSVAAGAQEIRWLEDPKAAIAEAKNVNKPLMVYVLGSTKDRDVKIERDQRRTLATPEIVQLAKRFVALRLYRGRDRDILNQFHLPESASMTMTFVTPDGEQLGGGDVGTTALAMPDTLQQKMEGALKEYGQQVYDKHLKPVLTNADAQPQELRNALKTVTEMRLEAASADTIALLDREKLDPAIRVEVYAALAAIADDASIKKLLEAAHTDAQAAKLLEKSGPRAAEILVRDLDANAEPFDYVAYKAATKIAGITNVKPASFFEKGKPEFKQKEVDRVKGLIEQRTQPGRGAPPPPQGGRMPAGRMPPGR